MLCSTNAIPAPRHSGSDSSGFCPAFGPILYLILGVNRIRRRAVLLGVHKTSQPAGFPKISANRNMTARNI